MKSDSSIEHREIPARELPFEFMLNALRLTEGFPVELFPARTGLPVAVIRQALQLAEERALLERDERRIRPTERGRRFLNDLISLFLARS